MRLFLTVMTLTFTAGCASVLKPNECDAETAYARGMNDAKNQFPMSEGIASQCREDQKADVQAGYRKGYLEHEHNKPNTMVVVAGGAPQVECIEAYGRRECGYDCIEAYGKLMCGQNPGDNCVEAYGKLRCGVACKESYGKIICAGD